MIKSGGIGSPFPGEMWAQKHTTYEGKGRVCPSRPCLRDERVSKGLRKGLKSRGHSLLATWPQTRTTGGVSEHLALD